MKISFVYLSRFPWKNGLTGGDRRFRDFCIGFQNSGIDVDVYIPSKFKKDCNVDSQPNLRINFLSFFNNFPVIHRLGFWFHLLFKLYTTKTSYLFLYNTSLDGAIVSVFARLFGIKVIYEICDLHFVPKRNNIRTYKWSFALWIYGYTSFLVVISEYLKKIVLDINPNSNILLSPIHIDTNEFKNALECKKVNLSQEWLNFIQNKIVVTYVGSLYDHEGVDILLKGFEKFKRIENTECVLIIVGKLLSNPYVNNLIKFVKDNNMTDSVLFTDWLGVDEVKDIYKISDILCLPQIKCSWNLAGMPTKLAEYCCTGKAIILTNVGDVNNYFNHMQNAFFINSDSFDEIVVALNHLINNVNDRLQIGKGAFELCNQKFDNNNNSKAIMCKLNI
jgi:glycosyltransferase involved in cell wall biosynthesis